MKQSKVAHQKTNMTPFGVMDSNYNWLRHWSSDTFDDSDLVIQFTKQNTWLITLTFNKLSSLYSKGHAEHYPRIMFNRSKEDWLHGSIQYDPESCDISPKNYCVECSQNNLDAAIDTLRTFVEELKTQQRPQDPHRWSSEKRYCGSGEAHNGVETPHVHDPKAPGGVRKPRPEEIPKGK